MCRGGVKKLKQYNIKKYALNMQVFGFGSKTDIFWSTRVYAGLCGA